MSTEAPTMVGLLQKGEDDFDVSIKAMPIKTLMDVISGLQKEMAKEQDNFNSLSGELQNRKEKNSRQSKQISKDMVTSQQRLTTLMNRSMKCFAQQNAAVSKGTQLKRRNSAKGLQPVMAPAEKLSATNIHRSRSMHSVNQPSASEPNGPAMKPSLSILSPKKNAASSSTTNDSSSVVSGSGDNKNHKPIIMKPSMNGGVASARNNSSNINNANNIIQKTAGSNNNTNNTAAINGEKVADGKGNASTAASGGNGGSNRIGDDGNAASATASSTTESTGGIYLKRKQQQQQQPSQKVLTTTNFSPSPAATPTPQITIASPSPSNASIANSATATAMLPPKAPLWRSTQNLSSTPSFSSSSSQSGKIQILQTKKRSPSVHSYPASLSGPMLMAQSRPGLSKSQIIGQSNGANNLLSTSPSSSSASATSETTNPADEFRGLPSVKMLAQSFGSNTALNTSTQNTNYTSGRGLSPGSRGVSRSTSSVCFGQSKNPHVSSNRIFLSKKTNSPGGNPPASTSNNTPMVNGGTQISHQQQQQKHFSDNNPVEQIDQRRRSNSQNSETIKLKSEGFKASSSPNTNGLSELEMARARLKSNRNSREVLESPQAPSPSENGQSNNTNNSSSTVSPVPSSELPPKSSSISTQSSKVNGGIPASSTTSTSTASQQAAKSDTINNSINKPQEPTAPVPAATRTGAYVKKSGVQGVTRAGMTQPKAPTTSSSTSSSTAKSSATISLAPFDPGNMRRSKSREELQTPTVQKMPDRGGLLKQIQARRVDPDGVTKSGGGGSNAQSMQSMAKLSRSMPSLLAAGG